MKIAVVILNWNGQKWLEKFLPDVVRYSPEAEVVVVDNNSTDNSSSWLFEKFPEVRLVQLSSNTGYAGGYNEGLKYIKADIFCLLNSDVQVTKDWLQRPMQLFKIHPEIAVIQPKILDFNTPKYFEFAGAAGGLIDNLGYPYCRGRKFDTLEQDTGQYDDEKEIFWASGCCLFIRSKDFWAVGGLDETFFAHQEEIDLCWRIKNYGRKIFYTYQSKIYHVGGGTLNKQSPQKTYLNIRNNLGMLVKNLPLWTLIWVIPLRLVLDGVAGIYFGINNGFPHLWAVVRAHFGFYVRLPKYLSSRKGKKLRTFSGLRWLVFRYYILGEKK